MPGGSLRQAERITKSEETTRTASEIIDAQETARDAKTERLRKTRLAAQTAQQNET